MEGMEIISQKEFDKMENVGTKGAWKPQSFREYYGEMVQKHKGERARYSLEGFFKDWRVDGEITGNNVSRQRWNIKQFLETERTNGKGKERKTIWEGMSEANNIVFKTRGNKEYVSFLLIPLWEQETGETEEETGEQETEEETGEQETEEESE